MEALGHLQSIQATLQLMQEYSLCSNEESSDRFVADFLLFLTQNCTEAEELSNRCTTLIHLLPKISKGFLQAVLSGESTVADVTEGDYRVESSTAEGNKPVGEVDRPSSPMARRRPEGKNGEPTKFTPVEDYQMPTTSYDDSLRSLPSVGLKAMEKARSTLEDFCRSYFMFHEMDVQNPHHVFKYLPILYFVEAFIYQADEDNEDQLQPPVPVVVIGAPGRASSPEAVDEMQVKAPPIIEENTGDAACIQTRSDEEKETESRDSGLDELNLEVDPFRDLRRVLNSVGLMTAGIESELRDGVEYWRLERKLCEAMNLGAKVTKEDVFKAIALKSFDYRILNHLLYSLSRQWVVEAHLEFLAVAELLVEIADDLFDYEDDVLKNSFNVLRLLTYACGPTEAPAVLAEYISDEETRYQELLEKLEPNLAERFQERCEEAVKEGGGVSKSGSLGAWTIPPLIVDEVAFRAQVSCQYAPVIREV